MSSSKIFGVMAILATLCFIALLALQVMEMTHYSAAPSLWPAAVR